MSARRNIAVLAAASLCGLALLSTACGRLSGGAALEGAVEVTAAQASLDFSVPAVGYLEATKASPIAVPRVPTGALKVKELVPEGSIVEAGDIVVVFDDTTLSIEMDNHRATFRSTDRQIDKTRVQLDIDAGTLSVMKEVAELERDNVDAFRIVDESIYSRLEILEEQVKKEEAQETILYADAGLILKGEYYDIEERILGVTKGEVSGKIDRVRTSLASLVLKAPIGGLIIYKKNWRGSTVAVGDTLWPGNLIMSIVDPASVALTAYVHEKDAAGVKEGSAALVVADARPDRTFQGVVKTIAEISRPIERQSPVKYTELRIDLVDGDPDLLKPGMKAEARIITGTVESAVVLPRSAVRGTPEDPFVLVDNGGGVEHRSVTLGPGDLVRVSVTKGLEGGERVLIGGTPEPGTVPAKADADGPSAGASAAAGGA